MTLHHVGIEVDDLFAVELFYRKALGFSLRYRYVSRTTPGLRTVLLERDGVRMELRERAAGAVASAGGGRARFALEVHDVDAEHARLASLQLRGGSIGTPRNAGDGCRKVQLRDPEGNVVELSARLGPDPHYPIRAVLFDLDGTLIDSEGNYSESDTELLARRGVVFTAEDKRRYIGTSVITMLEEMVRRHGLKDTPAQLVEEKNEIYMAIAEKKTRLFPEMKRFWDLLAGRGMPVAIASGSSTKVIHRLLELVGLAGQVQVVVSADQVARGKPAPDVFVEAARRLGVPAHECAVVEDSSPGVEAARRAFMRCIAVPYLHDKPLDDGFLMADLLFEDGMDTFDPLRALEWLDAQAMARG
jgi:HAD superfamily hydrolase (TIGR01509 family)